MWVCIKSGSGDDVKVNLKRDDRKGLSGWVTEIVTDPVDSGGRDMPLTSGVVVSLSSRSDDRSTAFAFARAGLLVSRSVRISVPRGLVGFCSEE